MIITDDIDLARQAKHITTTAKINHPHEFVHDEIGYNYRMPNLNVALGCAQIDRLDEFLDIKLNIAKREILFLKIKTLFFLSPLKAIKFKLLA